MGEYINMIENWFGIFMVLLDRHMTLLYSFDRALFCINGNGSADYDVSVYEIENTWFD